MDITLALVGSLTNFVHFFGDNIMEETSQSFAVQYGSHGLHADLNPIAS